jgi:hypothetical protein
MAPRTLQITALCKDSARRAPRARTRLSRVVQAATMSAPLPERPISPCAGGIHHTVGTAVAKAKTAIAA